MTNDPGAMRRAAALTRGGRLMEATRAIQDALGNASGSAAPADAATGPSSPGPTIDGEVVGRDDTARTGRPKAGRTPRNPGARTRPKATVRRAADGLSSPLSDHLPGTLSGSLASAFARTRARAKMPSSPSPIAVPPGARWEWRAGPDGRRYRLYVPASLSGMASAPLIVMLHGCTQNPDDFAAGTRMNDAAEKRGAVVVYPEQTRAENAMACWNWFEPAHQPTDQSTNESIDQSTGGEPGSIAAIAREATVELGLGRTVAMGLSAGGAMAAILGAAHPGTFSAIGIHSGLPAGAARDLGGAQRAMAKGGRAAMRSAVPTIVVHGEADRTVHPANGMAAFEAAAGTLPRTERLEGRASVTVATGPDGVPVAEHWRVPGLAHAWAGGDAGGSYTDPSAPDATTAMLRFMLG